MLTSPRKIDRYNDHTGPPGLTRPYRQPVSHLSACAPALGSTLPTPALIRAARALAAATGKHCGPTSATTTRPAITQNPAVNATNLTAVTNTTNNTTQHTSKAQQMQARALAAQAAHQRRLAAEDAAAAEAQAYPHDRLNGNADKEAPFQFGVGFMGFGGVPFGKPRVTQANADRMGNDLGVIGAVPASHTASSSCDIPEQYLDMVDELQVDLALQVVSNPSPQQVTTKFTSPSAPVNISAFLPAPGPPPLIATDASIAASAVPLANWAAELCWTLVSRPLVTLGTERVADLMDPSSTRASRNLQLAGNPRFASFRAFVKTALNATLPSPQCLFFGLYYLTQLPVGHIAARGYGSCPTHNPHNMSILDFAAATPETWAPIEKFRKALYGEDAGTGELGPERILKVARKTIALAVMLGNKWLEDNTFTTRTWHEVTGIAQRDIKTLETAALGILGYSLSVPEPFWTRWLLSLRSYTSALVAKEPIGMLGTPNSLTLGRLDSLIHIANAHTEDPSSMDDTYKGGEADAAAEREREERMERQALAAIEDDDDDDGDDMVVFPRAPRPHSLSNTAAFHVAGLGCGVMHTRTTSLPVNPVATPAEFGVDTQLDSPVGRKVGNNYAPVQRPTAPLVVHQPALTGGNYNSDGGNSRRNSYDAVTPPGLQPYWNVDARSSVASLERPYYVLHQNQSQTYTYVAPAPQPQIYCWQQVEAEIKARERELEASVSTWPRPSEMDWSGSTMWSRQTSTFAAGA